MHQQCADGPSGHRRHCIGEQDPHVGSPSRLGQLERGGNTEAGGGLHERQGVQHRHRSVEVGSDPPALIARQQWIQTDKHIAGQVGGDDVLRQWEMATARLSIPLRQPPATAGDHPATTFR